MGSSIDQVLPRCMNSRNRWHRLWLLAALGIPLLGAAGCCVVPVAVGNPIPGMTTVAVAPFFNLSAEPTVDGRRFAISYYSELQKTSNYQLIPVGIVETAIRENNLDMTSPADAVKLAQILGVDAVVVGAVTEYIPYYPPQLGVQINWYSPRDWIFYPGISSTSPAPVPETPACPAACPPGDARQPVVRGQMADDDDSERASPFPPPPAVKVAQAPRAASTAVPVPPIWPPEPELPLSGGSTSAGGSAAPPRSNGGACPDVQPEPVHPIMSYTRFFDGADRDLLQALKGYYLLRGDMRSGGWQAYLHRSDDFLRFASHVLVVEMLSLHGAPLTTEKVFLHGR
jgi:hypothetical protein